MGSKMILYSSLAHLSYGFINSMEGDLEEQESFQFPFFGTTGVKFLSNAKLQGDGTKAEGNTLERK